MDSNKLATKLIATHEGLAAIKEDGLVYPYLDPVGYPTQGYGIRVKSMDEPPITIEEATDRLQEHAEKYMGYTLALCPNLKHYPLSLAAITDFTYNVGASNLKISTLRKRILANDWKNVVKELHRWKYSKGRVLPGLVTRRANEAELIAMEHNLL